MYEAHPIYPVYIVPTYSESSASMATTPSIEIDPSEATPLHVIHLDSEASSTIGSKVEGRGGGG